MKQLLLICSFILSLNVIAQQYTETYTAMMFKNDTNDVWHGWLPTTLTVTYYLDGQGKVSSMYVDANPSGDWSDYIIFPKTEVMSNTFKEGIYIGEIYHYFEGVMSVFNNNGKTLESDCFVRYYDKGLFMVDYSSGIITQYQ